MKTHDTKICLTVFLICVAMLGLSATAWTQETPTGAEGGDEMLFFQEIPSVFGVSKYEQKVTQAPSSVTIVTADEIKKYGYRTLADILQSVRGLYFSYDRNYYYLGARGFSRPGDYNTRLLFMVDGIRMNDSVYDQGSIGTEFPMDIELIDRVEIIRGPSSSLYGSNAFFGVVNIITKRGRDLKGPEISGETGTFETHKARLTYGDRYTEGPEVLLSGTWYESEGDDRLYYPEFDDPATNYGFAEKADTDRSRSVFGKASFGDFTLEGIWGWREKRVPTGAYGTVFNDRRTLTDDETAMANLKYEHLFAGKLGVTAKVYYATYTYTGDYAYDYAEEGDLEPCLVINKDETVAEWWGSEVQLDVDTFENHRLVLGAEFRGNPRQDQKNYDEYDVYLDDTRDSTFWALFMQDEFRIRDNLTLSAGVRHDHYSTFGGTTNPRLALVYQPLDKTFLKLVYGTAFRAPNVYENYYHDGYSTTKPALDLEPETIETYEFVLEQYLGENLKGTLNGFYYRLEDLITLQTDPEDGLLVFDNADEIEVRGVEVELDGKWPSGLSTRLSYAYQHSRNEISGEVLTNSPEHLAKLNVVLPLYQEKVFLGMEELYTSKRRTIGGSSVGDDYIANLTLFCRDLLPHAEISLSAYNLFDRTYADPGSEEHLQDTLERDGRTFRLKLTLAF